MPDRTNPTNRTSNVCGPALATLLALQIIIGYEWLMSGITKAASGTFVSGLAGNLKTSSDTAPHWYQNILHSTIIPNARTFAVLAMIGEILVGVGLIVAATVWLTRWSRMSDRWRMSLLVATMVATVAATLMAINFHLLAGGNHPWLIPNQGFNETIDLDAFLVMLQTALFIFCGYVLRNIRREHRAAEINPVTPAATPAAVVSPPPVHRAPKAAAPV